MGCGIRPAELYGKLIADDVAIISKSFKLNDLAHEIRISLDDYDQRLNTGFLLRCKKTLGDAER